MAVMDPPSDRGPVLRIAPAAAADAAGIAAVHVAVWRSAYAGILPDRVLLRLSEPRLAAQYAAAIDGVGDSGARKDAARKDGAPKDGAPRDGAPRDGSPRDGAREDGARKDGGGHALVATAPDGTVVGFTTFAAGPPPLPGGGGRTWGEVETLYVHDDWRDRGIGRSLLAGAAASLRRLGCDAAFLNVLADNHSRWFYEHLGGRAQNTSVTYVGGQAMKQVAMAWDPIDKLADLA